MTFAILIPRRITIIQTKTFISPIWFRLFSEVSLVVSLSIISVWALGTYALESNFFNSVIVSTPTLAVACLTAVVAALTIVFKKRTWAHIVVYLLVLAVSSTLALSMHETGDLNSVYMPVWAFIALFASAAGVIPFLLALSVAIGYGILTWLGIGGDYTISEWLRFGLSVMFPLVVGLLVYLRSDKDKDRSEQVVNELASELHNESSKSSIIINGITDGVVLINRSGIIQLLNPAAQQIVGWGVEDATNLDYRSVLKIINSKDQIVEGGLDPIQQCINTGESVLTEKLGLRTVSGKQLLVSIMVSPLRDDENGVVVVFRDITSQRAEERGQAEFISTASHEMRTPVAAIEGYLGLALNPQTATIDEKARSFILKAQEAATHLGRLFQDLLDISKLEDGRMESTITVIDIPTFTRDLTQDFVTSARQKGLELIYLPDTLSQGVSPLFYANGDRDHMHEIVSNLITNAIKYTKEGTIKVDVKADDTHVYISVKDSGLGIPAEDIPHLFQKFYRVDNSDTREIGGTGLGLYLARRFAEDMGGHLTIDSTYGEGSTFTFDVPRITKEVAEQQLASQPTKQPVIKL